MPEDISFKIRNITLEDNEEPFDLPDDIEYSSAEQNSLSIIGKLLNPSQQKMSELIFELPRKWQLYERVRGVALSHESFQFIFKYEQDLELVLDKGLQTFDHWVFVIERWSPNPPPDFLHYVETWVRIRNVPVNHYTQKSIMRLANFAGQVVELAFDPTKAQSRDFVRALVRLHVDHPLRRYRIVNLPSGATTKILYDYERIQKRCYSCQRMNHDQENCPFIRQEDECFTSSNQAASSFSAPKPLIIPPEDPLFGILSEDQVGMDPSTGRFRMAPEVLLEMRQYLQHGPAEELFIRRERVKASIRSVKDDVIAQKRVFCLQPPPVFSRDVYKGKRLVFDFSTADLATSHQSSDKDKLLSSAINSGRQSALRRLSSPTPLQEEEPFQLDRAIIPYLPAPTVFSKGYLDSFDTGAGTSKGSRINRPSKFKILKHKALSFPNQPMQEDLPPAKRKRSTIQSVPSSNSKRSYFVVVPGKGIPQDP